MDVEEKKRSGVQSIDVGLRILMSLAEFPGPVALKDISARAEMSPSRCHRYLVSLIRGGLAVQEPDTGHYNLGTGALKLGLAALRRLDVMHFSVEALKTLQRQTGHTAMMTVWSDSGPTIVRMLESDAPIIVNIRIGSTLPLLTSASGQVFLSYLPRLATQPLVDLALANIPAGAANPKLHDEASINTMITEVRASGLSRIKGDLLPGLEAICAPIFDSQDDILAGLALLAPSGGLADDQGEAAQLLRSVAQEVSNKMGHENG
ncbi:MAG: IclR family transcriptional regulator [Marinosulfonomonas sp.]|nr:IclR family transcriptional regulator [Marinosulfonomonas sp.]